MKISMIGSGNIGSTAAFMIAYNGLCDHLVLVDYIKDKAVGESLDIRQGMAAMAKNILVEGSDDYSLTKNSDLIVVTAGVPRKPGESRLDLLNKNKGILQGITENIVKYNKNPMVLVVSNPVDVMTYLVYKKSEYPASRVFGLGTMLDTIRLKSRIMAEYNLQSCDVNALVIGEHGDSMVPVVDEQFKSKMQQFFTDVRDGAAQTIKTKGYTCFAPILAVTEVVDAIVNHKTRTLPLSCFLKEYGLCISVPTMITPEGVKPLPVKLNKSETEKFNNSVNLLRERVKELNL